MDKCKYKFVSGKTCVIDSLKNKNFCKNHRYYENKVNVNDFQWCKRHTKELFIFDENKNYYCKTCKKIKEKEDKKIYCKGITQDNNPCKFKPLENDTYCKLHQSYKKYKELIDSGKKICNEWIRGCWNECDNNFTRCLSCREEERTNEKKRRTSKKECAEEYNSKNIINKMCKECCSIVPQLFNLKCHKCYKDSHNSNKNRGDRDIYLTRLVNYKRGANNRKLKWDLTDDYAIALMKQTCNYCNELFQINGIDRIDSSKGYYNDNCVTSCFQCNSMKGAKNSNDFYKICEHIATYNNLYQGNLSKELFDKATTSTYTSYKYTAKGRGIIFNLNKNTLDELFKMKCTYCGNFKDGCNGIDRINSNLSYTINNCVSCCKTCNVMKLNFSEREFLQKCLAIVCKKNNIIYKPDISIEKEKMIQLFQNMKLIKETDNNDFTYKQEPSYYKSLIWNGNLDDINKIKIKLVFACANTILMDIWYYYRNNISSLGFQQTSHLAGRQIYILVKDEITEKYLGIISLNSDIPNLEDRDDKIGWTYEQRIINKKINYLMNLSTCVPLQPFGFNFTGGKLLTKLVFTKEVQEYYQNKYKNPLLGITTTGFYGKSIQYDRLKEIKFVGYTKGFSTFKIPTEVINKSREYLLIKGIKYSRKMHIITKVLSDLGLDRKDYMSDTYKGIYFGYCHPQAQDFLCEKITELKSFVGKTTNTIFTEWLPQATKRYNHLLNINNIQTPENYKKPEHKNINEQVIPLLSTNLILEEKSEILSEIKSSKPKKTYQDNKEYFQKHYQAKKEKELENRIIPTDKIVLPKNFSLYNEGDTKYLQYLKLNKGIRQSKKNKIVSNDIQTELNKLVKEVKEKYKGIVIDDITIINPQLFKLQEKETEKKEIIIIDSTIPKPKLPINFSITTILGTDKIQFSKVIDGLKIQEQRPIRSYDLQKEINKLVDELNELYNLNLEKQQINNPTNWKTSNKIIIKEDTDKKIKDREKAKRHIEKKKTEMGIDAFNALKAQKAKEYREKKKQQIIEL